MKKIISFFVVLMGAFLLSQPLMASAATTAYLSTNKTEIVVGQKFNVTISVNPNQIKNLVEKIQLNYSPDILEVVSFSFSNKWSALSQPGYDSIDNNAGVIIKTAGYPGGFTENSTFGTVTFLAKIKGDAKVSLGSGSLAFEENSQNGISGNSLNIKINEAALQEILSENISNNTTAEKNNKPQGIVTPSSNEKDTKKEVLSESIGNEESSTPNTSSEITGVVVSALEPAIENEQDKKTETGCNKNYFLLVTKLLVAIIIGYGLGYTTAKKSNKK